MTSEGQPMTSEGQPMTSEGQPTASEGQPTASEGQPMTSEGQPTASEGAAQGLVGAAVGVEGLRAVVRRFYDLMFDDVMIGFMFWGLDKERLIERELELTARFLGARGVSYQGRPLREAHARHQITGGQFHRRLQLLREAMEAEGLAEPVREAWVGHTLALRPQVTREEGSACHTQGAAGPGGAGP